MPRTKRSRWPALPKRGYGTGSLSRDAATGEIRARLPPAISPTRRSRLFPPDAATEAGAWLDSQIRPPEIATASPHDLLEDWAEHWHRTFVEPIRPHTTSRWQRYALRQLSPLYAVAVADLRPSQLQAVVSDLSGRLSPDTVRAIVIVWRKCLDAAVDDRLIDRNPAARLVVPARDRTARERRHLTAEDVAALWPLIRGHRFEAAYALLLGCGLRIGEILGLAWQHVDLERGEAWIGRQYTDGNWRPTPKGRNPHTIPLPAPVVAALRRHRATQPADATLVLESSWTGPRRKRTSYPPRPAGPVPWSRTVVVQEFAELLARAGVAPGSPHSGRHGLASRWLDAGVPPAVVAQRLGHAHAGTTLAFYAHPSEDGQALADELAAGWLPEPDPA